MIVAIFVLAIILLLAGLGGLVSAINLVPTDLGFTYFQAGVTTISAGCIILALGFATRTLNRSLKQLAAPEPVRTAPADPVIDLPPLPPVEPGFASAAPQSASSLSQTAVLAGGAVVAATGVLAATTSGQPASPGADDAGELPVPDEGPGAVSGKFVDELERDLFTGSEALPEPEPVSAQEIAAEAAIPRPELSMPELSMPEFSFPDFAPRPTLDIGIEAPLPVEAGDFAHSKLQAKSEEPERPEDTVVSLTPEEVAFPVEPEVAPSEASPAQGLIHDADFAAVADQELPPLAPLANLDVIGAYDSGGTRFTMYSDGSVVAAGPEDERRFRSLDELRSHIDNTLA